MKHPLFLILKLTGIGFEFLLGLSQRSYIDRVLNRFNMQDCRAREVPIAKGELPNRKNCPKSVIEQQQMENMPYASVVGSLMYAQVCTRLDIAFVDSMLGRFSSNPRLEH